MHNILYIQYDEIQVNIKIKSKYLFESLPRGDAVR